MNSLLEEAIRLRRSGRFRDALRHVSPLVYPDGRFRPRDGDALAEYALNLAQLGAPEAAQRILSRSKVPGPSEVFAGALCRMLLWDHGGAARELTLFRSLIDPSEYASWVAFANLLWCQLYIGDTEAVARGFDEARRTWRRHPVLHANALTTLRKASALHQLKTGDPLATQPDFAESLSLSPYDGLALRFSEWIALTFARATPRPAGAADALEIFVSEGLASGAFEFARECSLWRAFLDPSPSAEDRLMRRGVRTPFAGFAGFAARIADLLGAVDQGETHGPDVYLVDGKATSERPRDTVVVDPWGAHAGDFTRTESCILRVLSSDGYRPASIERLYLETHPDAHFQPDSSTQALYVALSRLRKKLSQCAPRWTILASPTHGFSLIVKGEALRLPGNGEGEGEGRRERAMLLEALRKSAAQEKSVGLAEQLGMTRGELERRTGLATRSLGRLLALLVEAGEIERLGRGPATAYRLCEKKK